MIKKIRYIALIFSQIVLFGQTPDELKRFMETYDKIKIDQEANDIVKKDIESEKDPEDQPVRLLIDPRDITDYYYEKLDVLKSDIDMLSRMLPYSDSIPPISYFGYDYFSRRDSIYLIDNFTVSESYVLGPGDELIFSLWGQAEQYKRSTIQRDGSIFIENVGLLNFSGKTLGDANDYAKNRFGKVYSTLNQSPPTSYFDLAVGKLKDINVAVIGNVKYPGNYVVNPNIGLINLIILCGGIEKTGSLRNIMIQRNGTIVDSLDLYPTITGNGFGSNLTFLNNDIIIIPNRSNSVAVTGAVWNQAYFEFKQNDSVEDLLRFAGGKNKYSTSNIILFNQRKNKSIFLKESENSKHKITFGDSLIVPYKLNIEKNITVSNGFKLYQIPWIEKLSFVKLLTILEIDYTKINSLVVSRKNKSNNDLKTIIIDSPFISEYVLPDDFITFQYAERLNSENMVSVKGNILHEGNYIINSETSLDSLFVLAGGLKFEKENIRITIKRDSIEFSPTALDFLVFNKDSVFVNRKLNLVEVAGGVHNSGFFEWKKNNRVRDYLKIAGGTTSYADSKHINYINPNGEAIRVTYFKNPIVQSGSQIIVAEKPDFELVQRQNNFQNINSLISSLISIALLINATNN